MQYLKLKSTSGMNKWLNLDTVGWIRDDTFEEDSTRKGKTDGK